MSIYDFTILEGQQKETINSGFWQNVFTNQKIPEKSLITHVQCMLENNVDVTSHDEKGIVPIFRVAFSICFRRRSGKKLLMMLLSAGADVTLRNTNTDGSCFALNSCEMACLIEKYVLENVLASKMHFNLENDFGWVTTYNTHSIFLRPRRIEETFKIDLLIMAL